MGPSVSPGAFDERCLDGYHDRARTTPATSLHQHHRLSRTTQGYPHPPPPQQQPSTPHPVCQAALDHRPHHWSPRGVVKTQLGAELVREVEGLLMTAAVAVVVMTSWSMGHLR